jgi:hypothetical protein
MFDLPTPLQCKGIEAYKDTWDLFFRYHKPGAAFDIQELAVTAGQDVAFAVAQSGRSLAYRPLASLRAGGRLRRPTATGHDRAADGADVGKRRVPAEIVCGARATPWASGEMAGGQMTTATPVRFPNLMIDARFLPSLLKWHRQVDLLPRQRRDPVTPVVAE